VFKQTKYVVLFNKTKIRSYHISASLIRQ